MTVQVSETGFAVVEIGGDPSQVVVTQVAISDIVELPVAGPQGPPGRDGSAGGQPLPVTTTISFPSSTWTVSHSFPYNPEVITRDMSGNVIWGDPSYPDGTHVTVTWAGAEAGTIELM